MAAVADHTRGNGQDGRVARLEANFVGIKEDVDHLSSDLRSFVASQATVNDKLAEAVAASRREIGEGLANIERKIAESKATPWSSIWAALGVGVIGMGMMGSGLVFFTNQSLGVVQNTVSGMAQKQAAHDAQIAAATDSAGALNARLTDRLGDLATTVRVAGEGVRNKLVEIETQFCAQDEISNLRWAEQERLNAQLYGKAMGEPKVTQPYYQPHIGKCATPATAAIQ